MAAPVSTADYIKAISYRRTVYPLSDKLPEGVTDAKIEQVVGDVLKIAPSAYNTQPFRVSIHLGEQHKKLWKIIRDQSLPLLQGAGEQVVNMMTQRFDMFEKAYGSVCFWEHTTTLTTSAQTHAAAAHMFPEWSEHANGMLQIHCWTALELEGLGANLQHMNMFPPAEAELKKAFGIPDDWKLRANMNIGGKTTDMPPVPEKIAPSESLKVFK